MLPVLLKILSIIGIVLLCILLFVILVLVLVLCVPFRYKIEFQKKEDINAGVRVTWLLHFVNVSVIYQKCVSLIIRVLGIPFIKRVLFDPDNKKKKAADTNITSDDNNDDGIPEDVVFADTTSDNIQSLDESEASTDTLIVPDEETIAKKRDEIENRFALGKTEDINKSEKKKEAADTESDNEEEASEKPDFFDELSEKIETVVDKVSDFFDKPEEFIDKIADTYDYYDHLLSTKGADKSIELLKNEVICILKSIRPRKSKININYASTDPEKAAKVYEIYGLLMPILPKNTNVTSDFEDDYILADVRVWGNIYIGYIAIHGLKIILNKRLKKFIKLLKREDK